MSASSISEISGLLTSPTRSLAAANRIRLARDIEVPTLQYWNYDPCLSHEMWKDPDGQIHTHEPKPGCRRCGLIPRRHQRVGAMWFVLKKKALLADITGSGKSVIFGMTIAMMKELGELSRKRVILVTRAPAVLQHTSELQRMLPGMKVMSASGTKQARMAIYCRQWDVLVVSQQIMLNDESFLGQLDYAAIFVDDVDALRNRQNKTTMAFRRLSAVIPRVYIITATPLHKRLTEMYSVTEMIGGRELFGSEWKFKREYVKEEKVSIVSRGGHRREISRVVGYTNVDDFRRKLGPLVLRRTADDIDDVEMPLVVPNDVWLELHPAQRAKYKELQQGVVSLIRDGKTQVKQADAMTKLIYGAQICSGLATLGEQDGPGMSVKLDWLIDHLQGDFLEDKVVVFSMWKNGVRAIQNRLMRENIGYETIWGEVSDKRERERARERFWDDPQCRVLIGTTSIEQSLNLQVARHLINIDMIMNPARMLQLSGRIKRQGSQHRSVYVHNLLTVDTQEERYLPTLEREAAITDSLFGTQNELFAPLPPSELLRLISP